MFISSRLEACQQDPPPPEEFPAEHTQRAHAHKDSRTKLPSCYASTSCFAASSWAKIWSQHWLASVFKAEQLEETNNVQNMYRMLQTLSTTLRNILRSDATELRRPRLPAAIARHELPTSAHS